MTDDQARKIDDLHRFWHIPPIKGQASRAEQLDELLTAYRTAKNTGRAILWIFGLVAAAGVAWANIKGLFK